MKIFTKRIASLIFLFAFTALGYCQVFNQNLNDDDKAVLESGNILIKKINYTKYACLENGISELSDELIARYKKLNPKYLAEVIQLKPYEGNENLPEQLQELLTNISDYAHIPYYSERHEEWYDLYSSAEIVSESGTENNKEIMADIDMSPFGIINQKINIEKKSNVLLYDSTNLNKLSYYDRFDCVYPEKMKMSILLFRDGDKWVLYGIGGVNAPRIPFFTERIDTSFINRIKTFCNYIFEHI